MWIVSVNVDYYPKCLVLIERTDRVEDAIKTLETLIKEVDNLRVTSLFNSYIWDEEDLKEELLIIKDLIEDYTTKERD